MSHKATNWLSGIEANLIGSSEFRVLFHLCDCHNPSQGCFPTQAYLLDACGVSNGTLNNALNALQSKGLILRHRAWDGRTKRQKPTRYTLGFEIDATQKPSPITGDGADSSLGGDPSPTSGPTRLQPTGEVTCKEPVNNLRATGARPFTSAERYAAKDVVSAISAGTFSRSQFVPARVRQLIIDEEMITVMGGIYPAH